MKARRNGIFWELGSRLFFSLEPVRFRSTSLYPEFYLGIILVAFL